MTGRMSNRIWWACVLALVTFSAARESPAQSAFYTFTSGPGGDGFVWDYDEPPSGLNDLPDGELFTTPDDVELYNYTGNVTFFDDNYLAAGNSSVINGDAWWGNPLFGGGEVDLGFYNTENGGIQSLSFDFAWAQAGVEVPDYLEIEIWDYEGGSEGDGLQTYFTVDLSEAFNAGGAYGGATGHAGHASITASELLDDITSEQFTEIEEMYFYLYDIETGGGTSEFAIDNVSVNGASANDSNVFPSGNGGTLNFSGATLAFSWPVGTGTATAGVEVTNDGGEATDYSTELVAGGELDDGGQVNGATINAGQSIYHPALVTLDRNQASGTYESDVLVKNDSNALDADDTVTMWINLHLAQQLTANNSSTVDLNTSPLLSLSNAAAPGGQYRAGVRVTGSTTTGPFLVTGFDVDEKVLPGAGASTGAAVFDRFGRLSGPYMGTVSLELEQTSQTGFFMHSADAVPSVVWNVEYDLSDQLADSVAVASTETFGPNKIGVNDVDTAATLLGGEASSAQTVDMQLVANPEAGGDRSALILGSVVDLEFTTPGDLYVMQMTYDEANLPIGFSENGLLPMFYDELAGRWVFAMDTNSDGGAGAVFHTTSFDDFLAGLGGSPPPLSAFGLDTANDQLWAILDHASLFGVGTPFLEGDMNGNGFLDAEDIQLFVQALTDRAGYDAQGYNVNADIVGDMDGSGALDLGDVGPFRALLASSAGAEATAVPEPASTLLVLCVAVGACCSGRPLDSATLCL